MTRLRFDSLAGNTFGRLAGATALIEHSFKSIPEMERQVTVALKIQAESEGWDYDDYDVARQELESDYRHWIPKYAGYAAIILLWSIVEVQLVECAERVAKEKASAFHVSDIKGSTLEAAVRLINILTGIDPTKDGTWPHLKDLQKARNIIVHRGGAISEESQQQNEFKKLISRNSNLGTTDGMLSGEELLVSTEFCLNSTAEIERFFKRLFNNLGLPNQGVTIEL